MQMGGFGRGSAMSNANQLVGNPEFMNMVRNSTSHCIRVPQLWNSCLRPEAESPDLDDHLTATDITTHPFSCLCVRTCGSHSVLVCLH